MNRNKSRKPRRQLLKQMEVLILAGNKAEAMKIYKNRLTAEERLCFNMRLVERLEKQEREDKPDDDSEDVPINPVESRSP